MNKHIDSAFQKLDEAFDDLGKGIDQAVKDAKTAPKADYSNKAELLKIRISALSDRIKAAVRILMNGEVTLQKKKK